MFLRILFYQNLGSRSDFQFQLDSSFSVSLIGVNIKPATGQLFHGGKLDIIAGISTGGLYHIQIITCSSPGDVSYDGAWNVLDIVALVNCVLASNCGDLDTGCSGDMNFDGNYNVLDIVALSNCILSSTCSE